MRAAPIGQHLNCILAGVEPASNEDRLQVQRSLRRREPGHGANTAQQLVDREPQLAATQLLHTAPPPGRLVSGLATFLPEPSTLHAQPAGRAQRQKSAGIDDRPRPSTLAHPAGPRASSAPASLTRGGWGLPYATTLPIKNPALNSRLLPRACVTQKRLILNHAWVLTFVGPKLPRYQSGYIYNQNATHSWSVQSSSKLPIFWR